MNPPYKNLTDKNDRLEKDITEKTTELSAVNQEFNSLDSNLKQLQRRNSKLEKEKERFANLNDELKKENGRLGTAMGELRKESNEIEKENERLKREVSQLSTSKESITEMIEKQLRAEFNKERIILSTNYEERARKLEIELENERNKGETSSIDKEEYEQLKAQLESVEKELAVTKTDLEVVIRERDALVVQPKVEEVDDEGDFFLGDLMVNEPDSK